MRQSKLIICVIILVAFFVSSSYASSTSNVVNYNDTLILDKSPYVHIEGIVTTLDGYMLRNVNIQLLGAEVDEERETGLDGKFSFGNMSHESTYNVSANLDMDFQLGLDVADLILLERIMASGEKDISIFERITADINGSGEITLLDAQILKSILLGEINDYTNNDAWKFRLQENIEKLRPNEINLNSGSNNPSFDIIGVKVGDLNQSIESELSLEKNDLPYYTLATSNKKFVVGEEVHIPISPEEDAAIQGFQLSIAYDPAVCHFNKIVAVDMPIKSDDYTVLHEEQGVINIVFHNTEAAYYKADVPLFELVFTSNIQGEVKDIITLHNGRFQSNIYDKTLAASTIEWLIKDDSKNNVTFYQNSPNPFTNFTTIDFSLPEEMEVTIEISDATGSPIYRNMNTYNEGENHMELREELGNHYGMLFVTIETAEYSEVKKMMRIQ